MAGRGLEMAPQVLALVPRGLDLTIEGSQPILTLLLMRLPTTLLHVKMISAITSVLTPALLQRRLVVVVDETTPVTTVREVELLLAPVEEEAAKVAEEGEGVDKEGTEMVPGVETTIEEVSTLTLKVLNKLGLVTSSQ